MHLIVIQPIDYFAYKTITYIEGRGHGCNFMHPTDFFSKADKWMRVIGMQQFSYTHPNSNVTISGQITVQNDVHMMDAITAILELGSLIN